MEPLVSIVTPAYNVEKYIEETINSVLNQTYKNWEMIVVDDCSNDNTLKLIQNFSKEDSRIKSYKNTINSGVSFTRNKAIDIAQGKYIAFLDADDLWDKEKLEKQIEFMEKNKILLSYTGYRKINSNGTLRGDINVPLKLNYDELLKNCLVGFLTGVYNQKKLGKYYFKDMKVEDYIYWLEMIKQTEFAYGIKDSLASYRVLENSRSSNKIDIVKYHWKIYYEIEKLGLLKAIKYYFIYIFRGLKRYRV